MGKSRVEMILQALHRLGKESKSGQPRFVPRAEQVTNAEPHATVPDTLLTYPPSLFFSLAHWAKENDQFLPWERKFIFDIGIYLSREWQLTEKQKKLALRMMDESLKRGFSAERYESGGAEDSSRPKPQEIHQQPEVLQSENTLKGRGVKSSQIRSYDINALELSPRSYYALRRAGIRTIGQLAALTDEEILKIRHIGVGYLDEITTKLAKWEAQDHLVDAQLQDAPGGIWDEESDATNHNGLSSGYSTSDTELHERMLQLARGLWETFEGYGILSEVQLPESFRLLLKRTVGIDPITLAGLKGLYLQPSLFNLEERGQWDRQRVEEAIGWLEIATGYESIDDEMKGLMSTLNEREQFVIMNRLGVGKRSTLSALGETLGLSRERVRQVERTAKTKLTREIGAAPILHAIAGITLLRHLIDVGLLKEEYSVDLLVTIGSACNDTVLALPSEFPPKSQTNISPLIRAAQRSTISKAKRLCRNSGAVRAISLVTEELSESDIECILQFGGFREISSGWWSKDFEWWVPKRIAKKVVSYCGPVPPATMRNALRKHLSRSEFPTPPSTVLTTLLEQTGLFVFRDGLLQFKQESTKRPRLTRPEAVFLETIEREGPVVSFGTIFTNITESGLSSASASLFLSRSPIVQKVKAGLYTLVGTHYDTNDIERANPESRRVATNSTIRPRTDGVVEFETNVGSWMKYGGVISCGRAKSMRGIWTLASQDDSKPEDLVVEGGFIRGLKKTAESLKIVPG